MMQMICFTMMENIAGLKESVSIIQTHMEQAERSKQYISGALAAMLDLGKGSGPMDHGFAIRNEYVKESEK